MLTQLHGTETSGHFGVSKTLQRLKQRFYWPSCGFDVKQWCENCDKCSSRKGPRRKPKGPLKLYNVGAPMERIAVDIMSPLPVTKQENKYLLVAIDYFTKWPEAYALPDQEARTVATVLVREFACRFGTTLELHSEQGRITLATQVSMFVNENCFAVIETLYLCKMKFRIDIIVYSWTCIFASLGYLIIDRFSV